MVYLIFVFSEEFSAGSSPSVKTFLFSTESKREQFVSDCVNEQMMNNERTDNLEFRGKGGWSYWLEQGEAELDCIYSDTGRIIKRY